MKRLLGWDTDRNVAQYHVQEGDDAYFHVAQDITEVVEAVHRAEASHWHGSDFRPVGMIPDVLMNQLILDGVPVFDEEGDAYLEKLLADTDYSKLRVR